MKQVITPYQPEISKFFCDKHVGKECFSQLKIVSWYGSEFDTNEIKVHLCDDCVKEMYGFLKNEYNVEPREMLI